GSPIRKQRSPPLRVSLAAAPKSRISVRRLLDPCAETDTNESHRIERAPHSQREFLFCIERSSIPEITGIKIGNHAEHSLLFLRSQLLVRNHVRGTNDNLGGYRGERERDRGKLISLMLGEYERRRNEGL